MLRLLSAFALLIALALPSVAQQADSTMTPDRRATGGAQALNDIMARQRVKASMKPFDVTRPAIRTRRLVLPTSLAPWAGHPILNCGALCASALQK